MNQSEKEKEKFQKLVENVSPKSHIFVDCFKAFFVGGFICVIGQIIHNINLSFGFSKDEASLITTISLVFISVVLTYLGIYEKIGKFGGAGSAVPITGFANAICAPALEFKKEGMILGVGAKMFLVSGPVILYGVLSSLIVGVFHFIISRVMIL